MNLKLPIYKFLGGGLALALLVLGFLMLQGPNGNSQNQSFSGSLRLALDPIQLTDPAKISADSEVLLGNTVYDYLIDVDADNKIQPRLATSWDISADGLTYTFTLTENATWHDGSPFTAADVVWSFNRLRDPAVGSSAASLLENVASIEASGTHEVTFTLTGVDVFFLFDLSDNKDVIVKNGSTDLADFNGTGPFRVTGGNIIDRLELSANPDYFVAGQPQLEKLEFIYFNDEAAKIAALRDGQVDVLWRLSIADLKSLEDVAGIRTTFIAGNSYDLIRLRTDVEPGNNPKVIQAFKLATNREELFEFVLQGVGSVGRDTPIGPFFKSYYTEQTPLPSHDPAAARALLTEAGFPADADGIHLKMTLNSSDGFGLSDLAQVLKEQWAEAGIDVDIKLQPSSLYFAGPWLEVPLGITSWGHRAVPQVLLDLSLVCGAKWNESRFCDAELESNIQLAGGSLDEQTRKDAYAEIQRILIERGPLLIPYFKAQTVALNDRVQGFALKAFAGRTDFRTVSVK